MAVGRARAHAEKSDDDYYRPEPASPARTLLNFNAAWVRASARARHIIFILTAAALTASSPAIPSAQAAGIRNVSFRQEGAGIVHVYYDLIAPRRARYKVRLDVSSDGGRVFDVSPRTLSGDVGVGISPGRRKHAVWKAGEDVDAGVAPELDGGRFVVRVRAFREAARHAPAGEASSGRSPGKAGIVWVTIPGGSFMMGSDLGSSDEKPRHRVRVKTFQMAKTEATFGQYRACVKAGACTSAHVSDGTCYFWSGSEWKKGGLSRSFQGDDQPAVCVDWNQAKAFAKWAGGRLPTEAEWEYAARSAGKERKYPWGNEKATCARAVLDDGGNGCGRNSTWPVCSKTKGNTRQGLCDMAGNVWEWTQDWYHKSYTGAPTDGRAWESPAGSYRVLRGGSWGLTAGYLRAAGRSYGRPGPRIATLGLRPVRSGR